MKKKKLQPAKAEVLPAKPGQYVTLKTGEIGMVIEITPTRAQISVQSISLARGTDGLMPQHFAYETHGLETNRVWVYARIFDVPVTDLAPL